MKYSFIVPVRNQPEDIYRLLESFVAHAHHNDYELIIVDNGSTRSAADCISIFEDKLPLLYLSYSTALGPSTARNLGVEQSKGAFLIFFDADTELTSHYFSALNRACADSVQFAGGTEGMPSDASIFQQAVHHIFASSFLSTGGIRGMNRSMENFKPRTYNMLVQRKYWQKIGGFSPKMRFGEDIDFSLRMEQAGHPGRLLSDLQVIHRRKSNIVAFFKQIYAIGQARVNLGRLHPGSTKLVHLLPMLFVLGVFLTIAAACAGFFMPLIGLGLYFLALCVEVSYKARNLWIGFMGIPVAFVQLIGYGTGYFAAQFGFYGKTFMTDAASSTN